MKKAVFDASGFPTAFYSDDIHGDNIPAAAIEITEDQWLDFIENQGARKWKNGEVVEYTPPSPPVDLAAYTAQKRWEKEIGGIEVNGLTVATDDRSKMMPSGARVAAMADPGFTTAWKGSGGSFVPLDAVAVIAISDAVLAHVSACFVLEAQVKAGIEAGTITTVEQIDAAFV